MTASKPPYPAQFRQQMVELVQAEMQPGDVFEIHTLGGGGFGKI